MWRILPLVSVSPFFFCHYFWQLRELEDQDIQRYFNTSVDAHLVLLFGYKTKDQTQSPWLHDNLLQKTPQKMIRSLVLRGTYFKFQVSLFHRSVELLFMPNAVQMNDISWFFSLIYLNHIFLILTAKWKLFLMCQEAHLQLINSRVFMLVFLLTILLFKRIK